MNYWKIILNDESEVFLEHKNYLSDNRIVREAIDQGLITPHDELLDIVEINSEEFENNALFD